jgi:hypothetical protein
VTPTILGGLHAIRVTGTASFEVLVLPPSPGLVGQVVVHCRRLSKTPYGTGAQVEAFVCARDMVQVQDLKVLFHLLGMEQVGDQLGIIVAAFTLDLFDDQLGVTFH